VSVAEFRMPSLGADMTEGTLLEWLVHPGDVVHRGDVVAVVDTAKSAIDVEVFQDGQVEALLVEPGTTVAVGAPLATLAALGAELAEPAEPAHRTQSPAVSSPIVRHLAHERGVDLAAVVGSGPGGAVTRADLPAAPPKLAKVPAVAPEQAPPGQPRVSASPFARRRAAELGIDLATVSGSAARGAVTVADVEAAAAARPPERPAVEKPAVEKPAVEKPASGPTKAGAMRAAIGALMARSKREIPHYYLQTTIDLDRALTWLESENQQRSASARILPAVLLIKAAATATREVRDMNGFFVDGAFHRSERVHVGVAVSLRGGGLIAPALHDADRLALPDLMEQLKDLVARSRGGRLTGSEMADPTITVTNLGDQGVELVHGVIYPPQVALVGFGRVVQRPWAVDGMLTVRRVLVATLAADHRVSDGHVGGLYLAAIDAALQQPEEL
jgi:pyruvate dehydrogenase E2 component (dihydrolipoamide acetyltransferase)